MAVIKTLMGQTVVTVVCNIIYPDPIADDPCQHERDTFKEHMHKMASAWRVVAFFVIVFLVPVLLITLPLYARYTLYPTRSLALTDADTLDLGSIASSFWCQGQRLSSNGTFDAFLLDDKPKPDKRRVRVTKEARVLVISEEVPTVRVLPLLKGSTFALDVCARWHGGVIIVVKGEKNFQSCFYKEVEDWDDLQERQLKALQSRSVDAALPPAVLHHSEQHTHFHPKFRSPEEGLEKTPQHKQVLPITTSDIVSSSIDDEDNDAREVFDEEKSESDSSFDNDETWVLNADARSVETSTVRLLDTTTPYAYSSSSTTSTTIKNTITELADELKSPSHTTPNINLTEQATTPSSAKPFSSTSPGFRDASKHPSKSSQSKMDTSTANKTAMNNVSGFKTQDDKAEEDEVELTNIVPTNDVSEEADKIFRARRSLEVEQDPHDGSDEQLHLEEQEKLRLLHSVVETMDVTAGNSSRSSSEEFMEKCKTTIIYADIRRIFKCSAENLTVKPKWQVRINETDNYYFIFSTDNSIEMNLMKYYLEVSRVMYKVSNNKDSCNNSSECAFPFSFLGSEAVVLEMTEPKFTTDEQVSNSIGNYEVQAVCQPRVVVYLVFILMVPFIILLFAFQ